MFPSAPSNRAGLADAALVPAAKYAQAAGIGNSILIIDADGRFREASFGLLDSLPRDGRVRRSFPSGESRRRTSQR
jgi:hypothetical protein